MEGSIDFRGTGSWVEIERASQASLIKKVSLPVPRSYAGYHSWQWFAIVNQGFSTYRVRQDWRFNGTSSSSSPGTCNSTLFPPKGASKWADNIAVYVRFPHELARIFH